MNILEKTKITKVITAVLIIALCFTMFPQMPFGAENVNAELEGKSQSNTKENKEKIILDKTETETTYDLGDGLKETTIHGGPVRFENKKGKLIDYDPSLTKLKTKETSLNDNDLKGYQYKNKVGDKINYIPENLSDETPILLEHDKYRLSFNPTSSAIETEENVAEFKRVKLKSEKIPSLYEDKDKKITDTAIYQSENNKIAYEYISQSSGIKENIILKKKPDSNEFEHEIYAKGMYPKIIKDHKKGENGLFFFDNKTDKKICVVEAPYMNDKTNEAYSEDIEYKIVKVKGKKDKYILKLIVDKEYLEDEKRIYPVTIDPTIIWLDPSQFIDTFTNNSSEGANTNYYNSNYTEMLIGQDPFEYSFYNTYLKFTDLKSLISNKILTSATLNLYETEKSEENAKVKINRISNPWDPHTIRSKSSMAIYQTDLDNFTTSGIKNRLSQIDLLTYVNNVANGTWEEHGLAFKLNTSGGYKLASFYGSRSVNTAYLPSLTIVYREPEPIPGPLASVSISPDSYNEKNIPKLFYSGITNGTAQYKIVECNKNGSNEKIFQDYGSKRAFNNTEIPDGNKLDDGKYYKYYLRGINGDDVTGPEKATNVITVDKTAPSYNFPDLIIGDSGKKYNGWTTDSDPTIRVSGVVEDGFGITASGVKYTVVNSGAQVPTTYKNAVNVKIKKSDSGNNTEVVTFKMDATDKNMNSGEYDIYVKIVDNFGNEGIPKRVTYKKHTEPTNIGLGIDFQGQSMGENIYRGKVFIKTVNEKQRVPFETGNLILLDQNNNVLETIDDEIYRNSTIPFDTSSISNGAYKLRYEIKDFFGYEKSVEKDFFIRNTVDMPQNIKIKSNYGTNSAITFNWKWGRYTPKDFSHLEYSTGGGIFHPIPNSEKDRLDGEETLNAGLNEDGQYNIIVKSVGRDDPPHLINYSTREFTYILDTTNPTVSISGYSSGILSGTVKDINLKRWEIGIKRKDSDDEFEILSRGIDEIDNDTIADIGDLSKYSAGIYTIRLRGLDYCNNTSYSDYEIAISSTMSTIPAGFKIKNFHNGINYLSKGIHNIERESIDSNPIPQGDTMWYINNHFIASGAAFSDDFSDSIKYPSGKINNIFAQINYNQWEQPENETTSRARYIVGNLYGKDEEQVTTENLGTHKFTDPIKSFELNVSEYGGNIRYFVRIDDSEKIEINRRIEYEISDLINGKTQANEIEIEVKLSGSSSGIRSLYLFVDTVNQPIFVSKQYYSKDIRMKTLVSYEFKSSDLISSKYIELNNGILRQRYNIWNSEAYLKTINSEKSIKSIKLDSREFISSSANEPIKYYIKLDDSDYIPIKKNQKYDVSSLVDGKMFADSMSVKITIGPSGLNSEVRSLKVITETVDQNKFVVSNIEKYKPTNLEVDKVINYKPTLKWDNRNSLDLPANVSYEVHKSNFEDFRPNENTLVADNLKQFYYTDIHTNDEAAYYKVRAVETTDVGNPPSKNYSDYAMVECEDILNRAEIEKPIGNIENRGYIDFNTPNASMSAEKADGNLLYTKNDIGGTGSVFGLELDRTYNSLSNIESEFGKGFDHSFNSALLYVKNINPTLSDVPVLKDIDGKFYEFTEHNEKDNTFLLSVPSKMELKVENKTHELAYANVTQGAIAQSIPTRLNTVYSLKYNDTIIHYFNELGEIVLSKDDTNNFMVYERDEESGLISRVVNNFKEYLSFEYNSEKDKITKVKLRDGSYMEYDYGFKGYLSKQTHVGTDGDKIDYKYGYTGLINTEKSKLNKVEDALGNTYKIDYSDDKVNKLTYPSNENYNLSYDIDNTTIIKRTGFSEISSENVKYDSDGFITEETAPNGKVTQYKYKRGLLSETITEYQPVTLLNNRINIGSTPDKISMKAAYDSKGDATSESNSQDASNTKYTYNDDGDVVREITTEGKGNNTINTITDYYYKYTEVSETITRKEITAVTSINGIETSRRIEIQDQYDNTLYEEDEDEESYEDHEYEYDNKGNGVKEEITQGSGEAAVTTGTDKTYDAMHRVITETNYTNTNNTKKIDSMVTHVYDSFGREIETRTNYPSSTSSAIEEIESKEYNKNGSIVSETDKKGVETQHTYNNMNKEISKIVLSQDLPPSVTSTVESYEDIEVRTYTGTKNIQNAHKTISIDANGVETVAYQDNMGNTIREESNGMRTDKIYTIDGRELSSINYPSNGYDARYATTKVYTYDKNNISATIINPTISNNNISVGNDSIVTQSEFNEVGKEIKKIDENGNETQFVYGDDTKDKLTAVIVPASPSSITTEYNYDAPQITGGNGKKVTTTTINAEGQRSRETINDAGNIVSIADHGKNLGGSGVSTRFTYDDKGNLVKEIYTNDNYKTYVYDEKNRVIIVKSFFAGDILDTETSYEYDSDDNIISMIDKKDNNIIRDTKYTYDKLGRITSFAESNELFTPQTLAHATFEFIYDNMNRLTQINYPDMRANEEDNEDLDGVVYIYDDSNHGRVSEIKAVIKGNEKTIRKYFYDPKNRVYEMWDYYNIRSQDKYRVKKISYDLHDRVTRIVNQDSSVYKENIDYRYDKKGQIIKENIKIQDGYQKPIISENRDYTYDFLDRLTSVVIAGKKSQNTSYFYDKIGNRLREVEGNNEILYTYNDYNWLMEKEDENGETLASYSYDKHGNQTKEEDKVTNQTTVNEYDSRNNLSSTTINNGNSILSETSSLYNGEGKRINKTVIEGGETNTTNYYYQNKSLSYTTNESGDKSAHNIYDLNDDIVKVKSYTRSFVNGVYLNCNTDIRGSVTSILYAGSTPVISYDYDVFGNTSENRKDNYDAIRGFNNEIRYSGGIYDDSTELYYLNARYYDPQNGRFLNMDTYRGNNLNPQSLHLYVYCGNDPINFIDPSGYSRSHPSTLKKKNKLFHKQADKNTKGDFTYYFDTLLWLVPIPGAGAAAKLVKVFAKTKQGARLVKTLGNSKAVKLAAERLKAPKNKPALCFVEGTLVSTKNGSKPIEDITKGDFVYSENPETGEEALKPVVQTFVNETKELVHLFAGEEEIVTTPEHPFYVPKQGWTEAIKLRAGDILVLQNGEYINVEMIQHEILERPVTVYNFEVADFHTYYVGSDGVLAHNFCGAKLTSAQAKKIAKELGYHKTNYFSSRQPVFKKGNRYITPDIDSHNGGVWKMASSVKKLGSRKTRMGTYNADLTKRIGD